MARKGISEEKKLEMVNMANEGLTVAEIAKEVEVSVPTVYRIFSEQGVSPQSMAGMSSLKPSDVAEFLERYEDLEPLVPLLNEFGITHNRMYQILKDAGIPPRRTRPEVKKARSASLDHAMDLYENTKFTIAEIVMETGVHQPTIHKEVRARGIPLRRPHMGVEVRSAKETSEAASE